MKELEIENEILHQRRAKPKKLLPYSPKINSWIYVSFIQAYRNKYTVKQLCKALKFPRGTYYAVINHKPSKREQEYNKFITQVLSVYIEFKKRYNALGYNTPQ